MDKAWLPDWVDNDRDGAGSDFRFDEYRNLSEPDQAELYEALASSLNAGRQRQPTAKTRESYERVVGCITANAIIALQSGSKTRVHYSRGKATYVGSHSPYHPPWLSSKLLREATDQLSANGYLRCIHGAAGPSAGNGWMRSTYEATPKFTALCEKLGLTAEKVIRDDANAPVLFISKEGGGLSGYDPTERAYADKIKLLRAWNSSTATADIALSPLASSEAQVRSSGPRDLYRQFSGSLAEHGRFYGGWWQNIPAADRAHITIRKERTVELDFQGLVARMLYHQEGREYEGDPYAIPEIQAAAERDGIPWKDVRPVVKQVFNFMLNAKKRGGYEQSDAFNGLPPSIAKTEVVEAIERFHAPIRHRFFKRQALRLMNQDARICEKVLSAGLRDDVIVLPVHDSFIVKQRHSDWLRVEMDKAYREELGFSPVIV